MSISSASDRPNLDTIVSGAMLQAFQGCANSEQLVTPATKLYEIGVDSLSTASICFVVHSCLRDKGILLPDEIVNHAVQDALTDTDASVKVVVRAVQQNFHAEMSRTSVSV